VKKRLLPYLVLLLIIPLFVSVSSASLISIQDTTAKVNQVFIVNVSCVPSEPIKSYEMKIRFNPDILTVISITAGDFFTGKPTFSSPNCVINNTDGAIINIYALTVGQQLMVTEPGVLFSITFTAVQNGSSTIGIYDAGVTNETRYLPLTITNGTVTVNGIWYPGNDIPPDDTPPDDDPPVDNNAPAQNKNDPNALSWITQNLIIVLIIGVIILFVIRSLVG